MKKYFNSKEEIIQFLIDKATEKYNLTEFQQLLGVQFCYKNTEECVRTIKEAGYSLDNFADDPTFDTEWIEIYNGLEEA